MLTERFRDFLKYYLLDEDYSLRDEIIPVEKIMGH